MKKGHQSSYREPGLNRPPMEDKRAEFRQTTEGIKRAICATGHHGTDSAPPQQTQPTIWSEPRIRSRPEYKNEPLSATTPIESQRAV
jgi:hypothetical protein